MMYIMFHSSYITEEDVEACQCTILFKGRGGAAMHYTDTKVIKQAKEEQQCIILTLNYKAGQRGAAVLL